MKAERRTGAATTNEVGLRGAAPKVYSAAMTTKTTLQAPFTGFKSHVRPEWIDYNGHMNVAYYVAAFDEATDAFYEALGIGLSYKNQTDCSTFTLEGHITYDQEVMEGDELRFTTYLLDCDAKRVHYIHEMHHAEKGYLASTNELIGIHIDMNERRSKEFPPELQERLQAALAAHRPIPKPAQVGRVIGIRRKG